MNTNADPEHAPTATTVPVERYIAAMDAAEMLWTVVANASNGDWTKQSAEWQEAAARWRDNWHAELPHFRELVPDPVRGASAVPAPPAPTPPADAQEPPWVVAGAQLAEPWERAAKAIEVGGRPLASVDVRCIEHACREHAAALAHSLKHHQDEACRHVKEILDLRAARDALAQERDALRVELKRYKAHPVEADPTEVARALNMIEWNRDLRVEVERLTAERDMLKRVVAEQGLRLPNEVSELQAERDRLVAVLRAAKDALEEVSLHHRARFSGTTEDQVKDVLAQIDAALAPTQKEEA